MRKLVNGKIVDIKNIDIFEKAAEGVAINRTLSNIIPNEELTVALPDSEVYIETYKKFYSSLPFPLYGIDSDIKYCAAGLFIKKETGGSHRMWLNNGLFICLDEDNKLSLGFVNNTWGIVKTDAMGDGNLNIQNFRDEIGFEDFVWVAASLFKGEGTSKYYETFMPKFVEACGNQPMVMRWELSNILQFGTVPDKIELYNNKIVDLVTKVEYIMDIFTAGTRPTKEKQQVWSIGEDVQASVRQKQVRVYGYDLYSKVHIPEDAAVKVGADKLKPAEIYGINSLFCTLYTVKTASDSNVFPDFCGFIADGNFVFSIENRIFIAKSDSYVEAKEIARGVEIYSYKRGVVYIVKPKLIALGIRKETIYSYSLLDGNLRLCKIQFVRT